MKAKSKTTKCFSPLPTENVKDNTHLADIKYNNYNIVGCSTNVDVLLNKWESDRKFIGDELSLNILYVDLRCIGHLGTKIPYSVRNSCIGCKLLKRLFNRSEDGINKSLEIQIGKKKNTRLLVKHTSYSVDDFKEYKAVNKSEFNDKSEFKNKSFISNYQVISCFIEKEMRKFNLTNFPNFLWSYGCGIGIITIEENLIEYFNTLMSKSHVSNGTLNYLSEKRVCKIKSKLRLILLQLCMLFMFLKTYSFSHNDISIDKIIITNKKCEITIADFTLKCPFTIHIIPSGHSSIEHRYHTNNRKNVKLKVHIQKLPPALCTKVTSGNCEDVLSKYSQLRVLCFKAGNFVYRNYDDVVENSTLNSSWDIYCCMIALMANKEFYDSLMLDDELNLIFQSMWVKSEYDRVISELEVLHEYRDTNDVNPSHRMISEMLKKFYLRCDGLEFLFKLLTL